jgi:excisionase family DNA binding protein
LYPRHGVKKNFRSLKRFYEPLGTLAKSFWLWFHLRMGPKHSKNISTFVNANVIAAQYGVTGRYVLQLAAAGKIPSLRIGRKCVRFDEAAVAEALGLGAKTFSSTPANGEGPPSGGSEV